MDGDALKPRRSYEGGKDKDLPAIDPTTFGQPEESKKKTIREMIYW